MNLDALLVVYSPSDFGFVVISFPVGTLNNIVTTLK